MNTTSNPLKHNDLFFFLTLFFFFTTSIHAQSKENFYSYNTYIGPEIYYVDRTKEGGTQQTGTLYGVRLGIDRIQRYKLYLGADFLWASGNLAGKREDVRLKSRLTDTNIETRFGYTFQTKSKNGASLTPYIGIGYFWESNYYKHPSPLEVHLNNTFAYVPVGFLSEVFITSNCSVGLNVKVRFLWDGEQVVSHDPDHHSVTQKYKEKPQYRIELPWSYFYCKDSHFLAVTLEPFYEYRSYGHGVNYPFDFMETTFKLYGATFKFSYLF